VPVPEPVQPQDAGPRSPVVAGVVRPHEPGAGDGVLAGNHERDVDDADVTGDRGCCTHPRSVFVSSM
jgi:hypothetical protein